GCVNLKSNLLLSFAWITVVLVQFASLHADEETIPRPAPHALPRISAAIEIDGDLNDAGWKEALVVDRFYETSPGNNTEPKAKTTAYLAYDDRNFYIGILASD